MRQGRALHWRALTLVAAAALAPSGAVATVGPSARELVEVADIEALSASPDGQRVAFRVQRPSIEHNGYFIDWYVANLTDGIVARVTDGGEPIYNDGLIEAEAPVWSPDSRFFYHRALVDGAIGIRRTAADGSQSRLIVNGDADVERFELSSDGLSLSYMTGPTRDEIERAERREYDEGILVDDRVDPTQNLVRGGFVHGRLSSQRLIGRWYQREGLLWRSPRMRHHFNVQTLEETGRETEPPPTVEPLTNSALLSRLSASSAHDGIATATEADGRTRLEVRRADGRSILCYASACEADHIAALAWRPGTRDLLFTSQDQHFRQSLHLWSPATGAVRRLIASDGQLSGGRSGSVPCAVTGSYAVCVGASAVSPPRLVRIDLARGRQVQLFDPNRDIRAHPAPLVEQLSWRLRDGRLATGTLLLPPGSHPARAPLFLTYYYCPGYLRGGAGDEFPLAPMVDAGFVVACLNIIPFKEWGDGVDRYRAALASVEALVDQLDRRGLIDRARVGMGGFSAGSEATMWVAMNSKLLAAAAVASPQYEPSSYWMSSVRGRDHPRVMREFLQAGPPDQDPQRWKLIAPALNTERITTPLLMQLPEQEARAAMELYARLSNTSTPVELYAFPDEGHIKIQPRHRFAIYRRNLDWFRYWLQGHADADPGRADQYRRWDELRRHRKESN